jgi:hypothetical protein
MKQIKPSRSVGCESLAEKKFLVRKEDVITLAMVRSEVRSTSEPLAVLRTDRSPFLLKRFLPFFAIYLVFTVRFLNVIVLGST